MATFSTRLGLRLPDPTDLVTVTTDINDSMTKIDAAVGYQVVTAFIAAPYSGQQVTFSNDGYRSYFNNGTAPASAGWVEVLNGSGVFGSNVNLAATRQVVIGVDTNLYRSAANILKTDDSFVAVGSITVGADLKLLNASGIYRPKLSSVTTVFNTTIETTIASQTIPALDAVVGAVYRMKAWGTLAVTATPTMTFVCRLGGSGGTAMVTFPAVTVRSGATDGRWELEFYVSCVSTGGAGTWAPMAKYEHNFLTSVTTYTLVGPITSAPVTRDTTTSADMVLTAKWNAASASNTITCQGFAAERMI